MRLDRKLVVLKAEQEAVKEEGEVNEALGARVATRVSAVARPPEVSKYRNHVEEVGKITSLLLGLSGRLARAENALYGMPADHAERVSMKFLASLHAWYKRSSAAPTKVDRTCKIGYCNLILAFGNQKIMGYTELRKQKINKI